MVGHRSEFFEPAIISDTKPTSQEEKIYIVIQ